MDGLRFEDLALRLVAAVVCGGLVGFDREQESRPAGLRTIALVALGSAAFVLLGMQTLAAVDGRAAPDPTRVLAGLIGGVGFLGAGTIIRTQGSVKGVTTAAALWAAAASGAACGLGEYTIAILTTALTFLILQLGAFEKAFLKNGGHGGDRAAGPAPAVGPGQGGAGFPDQPDDSGRAAEHGGRFQP